MDVWAPLSDAHRAWIVELNRELQAQGVAIRDGTGAALLPAHLWEVGSHDWERVARAAHRRQARWAGLWLDDLGNGQLRAHAALMKHGGLLVLRTHLEPPVLSLPSQAHAFPAADRVERHAADLYGVTFKGHPDPRRWTRHQAWPPDSFPLRKSFPLAGNPTPETPPDAGYPFLASPSPEVYEIPVGPVHAGIIEPGHFRFLAVGEAMLNLEERLGYVHKGIEKIAEGRDPESVARLAGRVSGDSTVAHAWATCMAMEQALGTVIPLRAFRLRGILTERERIANHLGDIGAICNDVGFPFANYQFSRLREQWLRDNAAWFGHRLLMDVVVPGGVAHDLAETDAGVMRDHMSALKHELDELRPILDANHSLQDRLVGAGHLSFETARDLGCLGYVGRASGFDIDLRRDRPYAPYDEVTVPTVLRTEGDVAARLNVRYDEINASLAIIAQLLDRLHPGPVIADLRPPGRPTEGIGLIEGWRGEVLSYVRLDATGRVARFYPRDPSVFNWPALEQLIHGNIVPDFPLCNKSVNGSYSGHDL